MSKWKSALELNSDRTINKGSKKDLRDSIRRGSDLKTYTEFRFNEHVDTAAKDSQIVEEATEFRVTYLIEDKWVAGIMNLRQPVSFYHGFGPRPSMSFFMYNEDGTQAIARPYLDGVTEPERHLYSHGDMPKYHLIKSNDAASNAPSQNFIYDFEMYRFMVKDDWRHVYTNDSSGRGLFGSLKDLSEASKEGCEFKVGIKGLCNDLSADSNQMEHLVFIHLNSCYYYTESKLMIGSTHPLIRVKPQIPMVYESDAWDFGWVVVRTNGVGFMRKVNPYSLQFTDFERKFEVQWYVR